MPVEGQWRRANTPLSRRDKRLLAVAAVAVVTVGAVGGVHAARSSARSDTGCVVVSLPSTMGGAEVRNCGAAAHTFCHLQGTVDSTVAEACRRQGFAADLRSIAAVGSTFPQASFAVTLSGESPAFLNGPWRLSFRAGGSYTTEHPPKQVVARGRIAVSGGTVTFGRETGSLACATAGRYRWSYSGKLLRLTVIADACGGREIVLTAKPFKRA
jgi:hypothetical protein